MSNEKELATALAQHRDEFTQFIWKRRVASKKDMRALFQTGPGSMSRLGDLIASSTLEALQSFERFNWARLCKDTISVGAVSEHDIPGYFYRQMFIVSPTTPAPVVVLPSRLEVHLARTARGDGSGGEEWGCVYATTGIWRARLMSLPTIRDIVKKTQGQIISHMSNPTPISFVTHLARLLDVVHPSHHLAASVLSYPLYAAQLLKRRLVSLGYDVPGGEEAPGMDSKMAMSIVGQVNGRLAKECRFYFEFSVPDKTSWRVGFTISPQTTHKTFPGQTSTSFGFCSTGQIFHNGQSYPYTTLADDPLYFMGSRTWGVLVDLYDGWIALVVDGKVLPPAFGVGASAFERAEQRTQRGLIWGYELSANSYLEQPQLRTNFGDHPFTYPVQALACNELLKHAPPKALDVTSIVDTNLERTDGGLDQEEEEKLHLSLEKNLFRANLAVEGQRSFSQFPPSIYRRSLACTKIQRAWRRHRGRILRAKIREEQYVAATLIQLAARKKLKRLRALKNEAAARIQKNWRRKKFIWIALMRCIYQQPIPELHRAATLIQRKWRNWHMFKNSPIATKYNARLEDLHRAVNVIIHWWRPLHKKMSEIRRLREKHHAATTIQRVYRGKPNRRLLRPDLRHRLRALGESVARHRFELLRIRGAYILQNAWRSYMYRRVRAEKVRTRHQAAARIQAVWKGYWVRSHIHLRFTYGEAVYLSAVCKSLRQSHFILKMYKPCGIVCPRRDESVAAASVKGRR
ncbi:hypothetical protein DFS34DRAFT_576986 [Phlyctochytrium arcticum]|nr:hypothetical protein DFS34DRAFT_576986 [Phlyctochytrium arcticum]